MSWRSLPRQIKKMISVSCATQVAAHLDLDLIEAQGDRNQLGLACSVITKSLIFLPAGVPAVLKLPLMHFPMQDISCRSRKCSPIFLACMLDTIRAGQVTVIAARKVSHHHWIPHSAE